jgi:prepilin-type processing-associated H-X9-DG protein
MKRGSRSAFSLVELLVTIGVTGILVGLLLPAVQKARDVAVRLSCLNNMKQIGTALHNYHGAHHRFPPLPANSGNIADPNAHLSWMALILPQMGEEPLYQQSVQACRADPNPVNNPPHVGFASVIRGYTCPADGRLGSPINDRTGFIASYTSYIGIGGTLPPGSPRGQKGVLGFVPGCRLEDIADGTSNTVMAGERPPPDSLQAGWWYPGFSRYGDVNGPNNDIILGQPPYPGDPCLITNGVFGPGRTDNACDRYHLWSLHTGGANFLFADGSARFLPYEARKILMALASRDGGEVVDVTW